MFFLSNIFPDFLNVLIIDLADGSFILSYLDTLVTDSPFFVTL